MSPQCREVRLAKVLSKALGPPYAEDPPPAPATSREHRPPSWENVGGVRAASGKVGALPPPPSPHTLSVGGQVRS